MGNLQTNGKMIRQIFALAVACALLTETASS